MHNVKSVAILAATMLTFSAVSTPVSITTYADTVDTTVTLSAVPDRVKITSCKTSASAVKIGWEKVTGADGYRIYRYSAKKQNWVKLSTVDSSVLQYRDSGLQGGTNYRYKVSAYKKTGSEIVWGKSCVQLTAKTKGKKQYEAYAELLAKYNKWCKKNNHDHHNDYNWLNWGYCSYCVVDIDDDGVKELILQTGTSAVDNKCRVYTYENGEAKLVGKFWNSHCDLLDRKGYLYQVYTQSGCSLYKITLSNDKVKTKYIRGFAFNDEGNAEFDAWSAKNGTNYLKFKKLTNTKALKNAL